MTIIDKHIDILECIISFYDIGYWPILEVIYVLLSASVEYLTSLFFLD